MRHLIDILDLTPAEIDELLATTTTFWPGSSLPSMRFLRP